MNTKAPGTTLRKAPKSSEIIMGATLPSTLSAPTTACAARMATGVHCGQLTVGTNSWV